MKPTTPHRCAAHRCRKTSRAQSAQRGPKPSGQISNRNPFRFSGKQRLWIAPKTHKAWRRAALIGQRNDHREIVGIFYQKAHRIVIERRRNQTDIPGRFLIDVRHQHHAKRLASGVYGTIHSHPISDAHPSFSDIAEGPQSGYALISDVVGDDYCLWSIRARRYRLLRRFDFCRSWVLEASE